MDDESLEMKTQQVLRQAQKVVADARKAIERTDSYFRENNLSQEKLLRYLELNSDAQLLNDVKARMETILQEAREDAKTLQAKSIDTAKPKKLKRFINHI